MDHNFFTVVAVAGVISLGGITGNQLQQTMQASNDSRVHVELPCQQLYPIKIEKWLGYKHTPREATLLFPDDDGGIEKVYMTTDRGRRNFCSVGIYKKEELDDVRVRANIFYKSPYPVFSVTEDRGKLFAKFKYEKRTHE